MDEEEYERRKHLSFQQAEGLTPLPTILAPKTASQGTRRLLLMFIEHVCDSRYNQYSNSSPHKAFMGAWVHLLERWHDEFPDTIYSFKAQMKIWLGKAKDGEVLEFVQWTARQPWLGADDFEILKSIVEGQRLAYTLIGEAGSDERRPTLYPRMSTEQADQLETDLSKLTTSGPNGARAHLQRAAELLQEGKTHESVRESISAVESVARAFGPDRKDTLGSALDKIAKIHPLHPALREAFKRLYGWTSDDDGIRHASIDEHAAVSDALAIFMISVCAAFCAFLSVELNAKT